MSTLNEILDRLKTMPVDVRAQLEKEVAKATKDLKWVPNAGPQTAAYKCQADELFYGGQAGGGKSDLGIGLALTNHKRSLILRHFNDDARSLADRMLEIVGDRNGWNGQLLKYMGKDRLIEFGGCQYEVDKQRYKGDPHDLIVFDEIPDFSETQYTFICAWNRSADANQRCRVVATGNPPTTPEGLWVIRRWAAWLDPQHPRPAKDGELRWYTSGEDGKEIEVDGPGPHVIGGEQVIARSRTFIRARLSDNPDLAATNYDSVLAGLPPELRAAYRDGRFDLSLEDNPWQLIPTHWVIAAQDRWTKTPPEGVPMCAIGADVAQGGADNNVLACRYDGWYAPLIVVPGKETPIGTDMAGKIIASRRNNAAVIIDAGGGYGGSAYKHLKDNDIPVTAYNGAEKSVRRTKDQTLAFHNRRAEAWWRFREALDPAQEQGSTIALPPDPELLADLCAPRYTTASGKIKVEPKEDIKDRIGRSPDKGDAAVMAWHVGPTIASHYETWQKRGKPTVILGHQAARRRH